jgi:hypothetical protein
VPALADFAVDDDVGCGNLIEALSKVIDGNQ